MADLPSVTSDRLGAWARRRGPGFSFDGNGGLDVPGHRFLAFVYRGYGLVLRARFSAEMTPVRRAEAVALCTRLLQEPTCPALAVYDDPEAPPAPDQDPSADLPRRVIVNAQVVTTVGEGMNDSQLATVMDDAVAALGAAVAALRQTLDELVPDMEED